MFEQNEWIYQWSVLVLAVQRGRDNPSNLRFIIRHPFNLENHVKFHIEIKSPSTIIKFPLTIKSNSYKISTHY